MQEAANARNQAQPDEEIPEIERNIQVRDIGKL